jgi:hypothetical protein
MRRLVILSLLALMFVWSASAGAQTLTGTISGKVTDEQGGVLPGVTVTLTSAQGPQTQVTDAKGEFRFIGLQPGTYSVKSELQGFRPKEQQAIDVGIGKTIDVTLAMAVGGLTEQVDVIANAVVIDTTSTATETNLSQDLLFTAPLSHTQAHNLLNYAPGINASSAFGGASDSANSLNIDGVDTRDPSGGTPWMFFNYNLLDEVQVGGIGQPAEYGGFSGAVVNSITKSGGNRFAFMTEIRYTGDWLGGDNTSAELKAKNPGLADPAVVNKMTDYTVQLGGPILRDKLFFFGNIQRYSQTDDPTGPRTIHTEISPRFNFKVTAQATRNDFLTFSMQYDQYNQTGRTGKVPTQAATDNQTRTEDAPNAMWNAQYRKIMGSTMFFEAKYTGYSGYYDLNPIDMSPYHYDGKTKVYSGGAGYISKHDRSRNQLNLSLSKYSEFHGTHNFKFGAEIERSTTRDRFEYAGGMYFYDWNGPYYAYNYSYDMKAKNKRESFYGQDTWKFGRFSANLGIRADRIRGDDAYAGELYSTFSVAPRLGLVYDVSGKGTSVVRAFYGQLYDGATQSAWWQAGGGITDLYAWEVGPGWKIIEPPAYIIPAENKYSVGKDLKHPRTDEISVAWEQQLGKNMKFSATGIFRDSKNFINSVLINGVWTPFTCSTSPACIPSATPPWTGPPITMYSWANKASIAQQYLIQNVDTVTYKMSDGSTITTDQKRKYQGLMLVLNRSMKDRWSAQVSYVLSKTDGNVSNGSSSGVSSSQFETPNGILTNSSGYAAYDRRHEFKVFGGYQIPVIEVRLDGYFYAVSGFNYTPYASINKKYTNWTGSISQNLESRGSRMVPTQKNLSLRIEKVFNYQIHRFGLYVDIDNLFNWGVVTGVVSRIDGTSILGKVVPFETPTSLIGARQATLGVRWSF